MRDRSTPIPRCAGWLTAIAVFCLLMASAKAHADVVGRLHFSVKNAADEKPLAGAKLVLKDSANTRPDVTLTTDAQGSVTSPQLEARAWQMVATADTYQDDSRSVTVVADTTTEVEVLLEPLKEKVVHVTAAKDIVNKGQVANGTVRDPEALKAIPLTGDNPFSFSSIIRSTPGAAEDSVNQEHVRGEHNATAININGFYLPSALAGRIGSIIVPETIQSLDIMTGGYAPEYGGETAAILNLDLRSGPIHPFHSFTFEGGEFSTFDGSLTLGGQFGKPIGAPQADGSVARRFGYLLDFTARRTQNALEPPQPDNQTAHNTGSSISAFGNFDYTAGAHDHFTMTLNTTPAYTQIANRTGLPAKFAPVGQGYGFNGVRDANGAVPGADPTLLGADTLLLASQQAAGQDINQRDGSDFGVINWRHTFNANLTGLLSLGLVHSSQEIKNNNPAVDPLALPIDNSIEYNPTIIRNSHHVQPQGSLTYSAGKHTVKGGLIDDEQEGDETYQLTPTSQLSLDALASSAPNLAPAGTLKVDANGNPVMDVLGHQVYNINPNNPNAPIVNVHRTGFYRAAYLQDTWNANKRLTLNYGLRFDWYRQSQNLGANPVDQANLSPRVNLSYLVAKRTVGRISYNRLFIQPPLAQGAVLGASIVPETLSQYDASIERQVGPGQTFKIAYYVKDIRNQIDTGLLIPFTQIGVFSTLNFTDGNVHGLELSYDLTPRNNVGLSAYANYTNSLAKPNGVDNVGGDAPDYNDHDQLNTINVGAAYTWRSGASAGLNLYYGSGLASSSLVSLVSSNAVDNGSRQSTTQVNLSLSSGPRLFPGGHGGVTLTIANLFDDRSVLNFNSGFSGTRFVQGRTILFGINGKF
ncbi:MAG: hypothetical protein JWL77_6187 [Chthonomonadaceae bacterium]|nr:hypothetical protein [Chthonomonadaceae bacterium]